LDASETPPNNTIHVKQEPNATSSVLLPRPIKAEPIQASLDPTDVRVRTSIENGQEVTEILESDDELDVSAAPGLADAEVDLEDSEPVVSTHYCLSLFRTNECRTGQRPVIGEIQIQSHHHPVRLLLLAVRYVVRSSQS
jgi:hypothetical protein